MAHEHGHCLYANGHINYGKVVAGAGADGFFSPYEMVLFGYMTPTIVTFNNGTPYNLKDYSARDNSNGYILKVPMENNEYFFITNRSNYSKWDKAMMGDSARINTFDCISELGSGVYIHHVNKEISLPDGNERVQDLECADGLWTYTYDTQESMYAYDIGYCFNNGMWNVYKKDQVVYSNDIGMYNPSGFGDDKSCNYYIWAQKGKSPQDPCSFGLDRFYTTKEEYIAFDQLMGDRFDAWKMNYNEVFSPYSSPNTNTWNTSPTNQNSGIFIVLKGQQSDKSFDIDIFKVSQEMPLSKILRNTPPSRPMGLKISSTDCIDRNRYVKLNWNHNQEPDMLQGNNSQFKRYKIYRAFDAYGTLPVDYTQIADIQLNTNNEPEFIDYDAYTSCMGGIGYSNSLRYKIKAIDIYEDESVFSDFVQISTEELNRGKGMPQTGTLNNLPRKYVLQQNYPNPFNPVTKISYQLPNESFVSIKVYDITGRLIKELVNETKLAGYYTVDFNGSEFSSGIYFCRMQAGNYIDVKRMVMIK